MADTLSVFRILPVGNIDQAFVKNRRRDQLVAGPRPDRVFRIRIELPELLARRSCEAADPAVALCVDRLNDATDFRDRGRGPLPMQDVFTRRVVFPDKLARFLVEGDDRWCPR